VPRIRPAVLAAAAALTLAAVAGGASAATSGRSAGSQTFSYVSVSQIMIGWDPATGYSNEILAMSNMYETLTRYNSKTRKVEPQLARSFTSNKAGTTWTFVLRSGVKFHTGRVMDAAAAKAAIMRTIKTAGGASYIWGAVKTIDTPNKHTLVFHLKYPAPLDLQASADYAAYIYDTKAAGGQDLGKWFESGHEAGTGPYELDQWNKGQQVEVRLKQFPGYWKGWSGSHYSNVQFWVVPSVTTQAQLVRSGQVSFVERLNPQLWSSFKTSSSVSATQAPSWQNLLALLNTSSGPLADKRVRQAVEVAIDYDGIVAALKGSATRQVGIVPPGLWGHVNAVPYSTTNTNQAKTLLKQAGYGPGGKKLSLLLTHVQGDSDEELVSALIKSNLAPLNIDVQVQALQWPVQWGKGKSANTKTRQDIFLFYWWPDYADPYSWFINLFHSEDKPFYNLSYYKNKQVDTQMELAEKLAGTKRNKSISLYGQVQRTLATDGAVAPLYVQQYQHVVAKSVGGFVDNPAYPNVAFAYDLTPKS
jgi:peptide/nickel transport system substrate-binding protein